MKTVLRQFIRESLVHEAVGSSTFGLNLSTDVKLQAGDDVVDNAISSIFDSGKNSWLTRKIQEKFRNARREAKLNAADPKKKGTVMSNIYYYGLRIVGGVAAGGGAYTVAKNIEKIPVLGDAYKALMGDGNDTTEAAATADNFINFHNDLANYLDDNEDQISADLMSPQTDKFDLAKFKSHYDSLVNKFIAAKNFNEYFNKIDQLSDYDKPIIGLIKKHKTSDDVGAASVDALRNWAYLSLVVHTSDKFISGAMLLDVNRYGDSGVPDDLKDDVEDFINNIDAKIENAARVKEAKKAFKELGVYN